MGRMYQTRDLANAIALLADNLHAEDWEALSPGIGVGPLKVFSGPVLPTASNKVAQVAEPQVIRASKQIEGARPLEEPSIYFSSPITRDVAAPRPLVDLSDWPQPLASREFAAQHLRRQRTLPKSKIAIAKSPDKMSFHWAAKSWRTLVRGVSLLTDLGLVLASSLLCIGSGWVFLSRYLSEKNTKYSTQPAIEQFWQWAIYFKPIEIIAGFSVIFIMYQIIFRWLVGKTPGQLLLNQDAGETFASIEGISEKSK